MSGDGSDDIDMVEQLRALDRDRFMTAQFAPPQLRGELLALYSFNLEVARIAEAVSEPMIGEIRLAWWREAIEAIYAGQAPRHEVMTALAPAIERCQLPRELFVRLIDARLRDLDEAPPATLGDLLVYAEETSATLAELALRLLVGEAGDEALVAARKVGVAWALSGILRAIPYHAGQGRLLLPSDLLLAQDVDPHDVLHGRPTAGLLEITRQIHGKAVEAVKEARQLRSYVPRGAVPALLPATLAAGYLKALAGAGFDPFAVNYERGALARTAVLMARGVSRRY